MSSFADSYIGRLRQHVGKSMLIVPGARAIIQDERGDYLFVKRRDNGNWVMPAGCIELDESILDCLTREVEEETGLNVTAAVPVALYTHPRYSYINAFGEQNQLFTVSFWVREWSGGLMRVTDETVDARFFPANDLPEVPSIYRETIDDWKSFSGQFILK